MIGIIYKISNLVNEKIYIGQTTRTLKQRMAEHKSSTDTAIGHAINKYGLENFHTEIVEECETLDELNEREIFWIVHYDCIAPKGYNLTTGGKNGGTLSAETKTKISTGNKGKKLSPETCKRISESKKGVKQSAEVRAKRSAAQKGKPKSEAARAKMREVQTYNRKKNICLETGEVFESILAAGEHYGISGGEISDTCNGNRNTAGGLHWSLYEDWLKMDEASRTDFLAKLPHRRKKVICIETEKIFSSLREAARSCNGDHKVIDRACKKSTRTAYGHHWKFLND